MKITGLEKQKKNKKRYNLYVDGEFFEGLEENTVAVLNLYVGKDLEEEELDKIRMVELEEKLHGMSLSLLGRYRKTEEEMRRYILSKGYSSGIAEKEISRLKEYDFIDDARYVRDYLELNGTDSLRMVRYKLRIKGINDLFFENASSNIDTAARESKVLCKAAAKKIRSLRGCDNPRDRIYRYLMGKGFDSGMIINIIEEMKLNEKE